MKSVINSENLFSDSLPIAAILSLNLSLHTSGEPISFVKPKNIIFCILEFGLTRVCLA